METAVSISSMLSPSVSALDAAPLSDDVIAPRDRFTSALAGAHGKENAQVAAREAAEEFVAQALIEPILKSLRENNEASAPFAPGDAERRFGPQWDAAIAHRISKASHFPVVDEIAKRLIAAGGVGASTPLAQEVDIHA